MLVGGGVFADFFREGGEVLGFGGEFDERGVEFCFCLFRRVVEGGNEDVACLNALRQGERTGVFGEPFAGFFVADFGEWSNFEFYVFFMLDARGE